MLNVLKVLLQVYSKTSFINCYTGAHHLMEHAVASCIDATQCAINHAMQYTSREIVFQRDMFLDIPVIVDLVAIRERRQSLIDESLRRQSKKRIEHHYNVVDQVWIKVYDPKKGDDKLYGPYKIQEFRTNGTVVVVRNEIGNVLETSWNLTEVLLLYKAQELCTKKKANLITSLLKKQIEGQLTLLKDLLQGGKSVVSLWICPGCPLYLTRSLYLF